MYILALYISCIYLLHDYLDAFMMQIFKYALHDPGCVHDANISLVSTSIGVGPKSKLFRARQVFRYFR